MSNEDFEKILETELKSGDGSVTLTHLKPIKGILISALKKAYNEGIRSCKDAFHGNNSQMTNRRYSAMQVIDTLERLKIK